MLMGCLVKSTMELQAFPVITVNYKGGPSGGETGPRPTLRPLCVRCCRPALSPKERLNNLRKGDKIPMTRFQHSENRTI